MATTRPLHLSRLLLFPLLAVAASCASAQQRLYAPSTPGLTLPQPTCSPVKVPTPPAVAKGEAAGVAVLQFVVRPDGRIGHVESLDKRSAPLLVETALEWIQGCTFTPGLLEGKQVPVQLTQIFSFHPERAPDPGEPPPLSWAEAQKSGLSAPQMGKCTPESPLLPAPVHVEFTVHRDGHGGEVQPAQGDQPLPQALQLVQAWLESCPFAPAQDARGTRFPVRVPFFAAAAGLRAFGPPGRDGSDAGRDGGTGPGPGNPRSGDRGRR